MKRETDSGHPIKAISTPKDIDGFDYESDLGDAGSYPYSRAAYRDAYRRRLLIQRMTAGLGSSTETNEVLKTYREMGEGGCVL
jgi:methylmalonyl-CoA mutase N-terminal domain/subunit